WSDPPRPRSRRRAGGGRGSRARVRRRAGRTPPRGRANAPPPRPRRASPPPSDLEGDLRVERGAVQREGGLGGQEVEQLAVEVLDPALLREQAEDRDDAGDVAVELEGHAGGQPALQPG